MLLPAPFLPYQQQGDYHARLLHPLRDDSFSSARAVAGLLSKEKVIMSLGYPLTSKNTALDALIWRYWISGLHEYQISWGNEWVHKIVADMALKTEAVYPSCLA